MNTLVERLRQWRGFDDIDLAADTIERLTVERDALRAALAKAADALSVAADEIDKNEYFRLSESAALTKAAAASARQALTGEKT